MPRQTTLGVVDRQIQLTPLTPRRPGLSRWPLMALPMCAAFGAFGAIIWLSHPGGAPIGEPPLIQAALTPIKMALKVDELLSAPDRASTAGAVFVAVAGAAIDPAVASDQIRAARPDVNGTSATSNGQQIQTAALPSSERDDVDPQDREQAMLTALAAEAKSFDLLTSPVADAGSPPPPGGTDVREPRSPPASTAELEGALPRPAPVRAIQRDGAEASASPPTETSVPATTMATLAATGAAAAPSSVPRRVFRVQLAAVRAEADARRAWQQLQNDPGGMLSELEPYFERAETDNGIFYRVQVGPLASAVAADSLCDELKQRNASCFVVRR